MIASEYLEFLPEWSQRLIKENGFLLDLVDSDEVEMFDIKKRKLHSLFFYLIKRAGLQ